MVNQIGAIAGILVAAIAVGGFFMKCLSRLKQIWIANDRQSTLLASMDTTLTQHIQVVHAEQDRRLTALESGRRRHT